MRKLSLSTAYHKKVPLDDFKRDICYCIGSNRIGSYDGCPNAAIILNFPEVCES